MPGQGNKNRKPKGKGNVLKETGLDTTRSTTGVNTSKKKDNNTNNTESTSEKKKGDPDKWGAHNITGERLLNAGQNIINTLQGNSEDSQYDVSMTPLSDSSKNFTMARAPSEGILSDADRKELDKMYE